MRLLFSLAPVDVSPCYGKKQKALGHPGLLPEVEKSWPERAHSPFPLTSIPWRSSNSKQRELDINHYSSGVVGQEATIALHTALVLHKCTITQCRLWKYNPDLGLYSFSFMFQLKDALFLQQSLLAWIFKDGSYPCLTLERLPHQKLKPGRHPSEKTYLVWSRKKVLRNMRQKRTPGSTIHSVSHLTIIKFQKI